jgi:hypothetical protein
MSSALRAALVTVTVQEAFLPLPDFAVMTAVPFFFAVIKPFEFTEATDGLLLDHVTFLFAPAGFMLTVNCFAAPMLNLTLVGASVTFDTAGVPFETAKAVCTDSDINKIAMAVFKYFFIFS